MEDLQNCDVPEANNKTEEPPFPTDKGINCLPQRFLGIMGFDKRKNDIVYCRPYSVCAGEEDDVLVESDSMSSVKKRRRPKVLLYFGGDIQDFKELMELHRDHRHYSSWNLESIAQILQKQFPFHHIVVVRASRIQLHTFSCYDNFVNCNSTGAPDHVITHSSLHHIELLLKNLSVAVMESEKRRQSACKNNGHSEDDDSLVTSTTTEDATSSVKSGTTPLQENSNNLDERPSSSNKEACNPHFERGHLSFVGFSKGCVVLNQMLYEFHYLKTLTPDDLSMEYFVSCIEDMYWLDGGHNGGKNTWITSRSLLETLTRLGIRIHVHMTPYQLTDERRPWIRREEKMFSDLLKRFEAPLQRYVHFERESPTIIHHFQLIAQFALMESEDEGQVECPTESSNCVDALTPE